MLLVPTHCYSAIMHVVAFPECCQNVSFGNVQQYILFFHISSYKVFFFCSFIMANRKANSQYSVDLDHLHTCYLKCLPYIYCYIHRKQCLAQNSLSHLLISICSYDECMQPFLVKRLLC